ncbi:hypothetical protein KJ855_03795 [Patescibacteria group bacterium]|nr:hypothetical protein [Patescibacteria group bacterium]
MKVFWICLAALVFLALGPVQLMAQDSDEKILIFDRNPLGGRVFEVTNLGSYMDDSMYSSVVDPDSFGTSVTVSPGDRIEFRLYLYNQIPGSGMFDDPSCEVGWGFWEGLVLAWFFYYPGRFFVVFGNIGPLIDGVGDELGEL